MRYLPVLIALTLLPACGGLAWNTTVADTPEVRRAMAASVVPGQTTETEFLTRWGQPLQKAREGGRTEFIYRNRAGDSSRFVIVTFDYGIARGVRTSETERCRATFPMQPLGPTVDRPEEVMPINDCGDFASTEILDDSQGTGRNSTATDAAKMK